MEQYSAVKFAIGFEKFLVIPKSPKIVYKVDKKIGQDSFKMETDC